MNKMLPICFYSTKQIILDDNQAFTNSILFKMHGKPVMAYQSANDALDFLVNRYQPSLKATDLIESDLPFVDASMEQVINVSIEKLKGPYVKNQEDISVILVDYHMVEMNGIEFLKRIQHLPIKKAIITGESDYKIGVDAFNQGLVDAYLRKDAPDFSLALDELISGLKWQYFSSLSECVPQISCFEYLLNDKLTLKFKSLVKGDEFKSYYLDHTQGDFIIEFNDQSKEVWLVRSLEQLQEMAKVAEEDGASLQVVHQLRDGLMIPYFGGLAYWEVPGSEWTSYLQPISEHLSDGQLFFAKVGAKNE